MSAIEVIGGDFKQDRRSRFDSAVMVLCQQVTRNHVIETVRGVGYRLNRASGGAAE